MADFGFVIFDDIRTKKKENTDKIKSLALKLFDRFIGFLFNAGFFKTQFGTRVYLKNKKEELAKSTSCFDLLETLKAWVIKLPFSAGIYSRLNQGLVFEYLTNLCEGKKIESCLVPSAIRDDAERNGFKLIPSSKNKLLFKSLLVPAVEELYQKAGRRLDQLDMVVVSGSDDEELFSIVRQLEPHISFITVISPNKDEIENTFTDLFVDSGLAFTIRSEYKSHLKNAELILNLGNLSDISKYRMSKKALIINLDASTVSLVQGETQVVNDISVEIPGTEVKNLMYELRGYYSRAEVYDTVIFNKLELEKHFQYTCETANIIMHDFKKAGLRICGYIGRRGTLNMESVIKAMA